MLRQCIKRLYNVQHVMQHPPSDSSKLRLPALSSSELTTSLGLAWTSSSNFKCLLLHYMPFQLRAVRSPNSLVQSVARQTD